MGATFPIGWMFLTAEEYLYCGMPRSKDGEMGARVPSVWVPMLAGREAGTFARKRGANKHLHML